MKAALSQSSYRWSADLHRQTPDREKDTHPQASILIVEDDNTVAEALGDLVRSLGFEATVANQCAEALSRFGDDHFSLLIIDLGLPDGNGLDLANRIHREAPGTPIILTTGWLVALEDNVLARAGVGQVLRKPFPRSELQRGITRLLQIQGNGTH